MYMTITLSCAVLLVRPVFVGCGLLVCVYLQTTQRVGRRATELWTHDHMVSEETQAKVQAMKMMVRWLHAIQGTENSGKYCTSTLRMLNTVLTTSGDLMEAKRIALVYNLRCVVSILFT